MRILILNHTAQVSGAERSLLDLLAGLPADVRAVVASPPGPLSARAVTAGVRVAPITGTDVSLKLAPRAAAAGVAQLVRAGLEGARYASRLRVDVLHANSIRAAISAVVAGRVGGRPVVAHIRDTLPPGPVSDATLALIARGATVVVANSVHTADAFRTSTGREDVEVAYNAIDLARFTPDRHNGAAIRAKLGIAPDAPVLAVTGQITPWKGQDEAVQVLERLHERWPNAHLLVIGEAKFVSENTRYDNPAYLAEIKRRVAAAGLGERVRFLGERQDVPELLAATDVLLVPSWEEPFGRVVVEGMAMGLPVLATSAGGPAELIEDGRTGMLAPPRDVDAWTRRAFELLAAPELRTRLGGDARAHAQGFGVTAHGARMRELYALAAGR